MAEFRDSIEIAATPETVFEYLTTNEGVTAWLGEYADLDPRPGGGFTVDVAGYPVRGEFLVVETPRRVVVSWGFAGNDHLPAGASRVEFLLTPVGTGTRVDLHHFDLPDTEVPGHAHGWGHFLPRLEIAAEGGAPGADDWQPLGEKPAAPPRTPNREES